MKHKILSFLLLISFSFLIGCETLNNIPPEEYDLTPGHQGEDYEGVEYPPTARVLDYRW